MNQEATFRTILLAGICLFGPIGLYYRLKSHTGEKLDRNQEGWFMFIGLRFVALLGGLGLIAYLINPAWMQWSSLPLPGTLRWAGAPIGLAAGALMLWTFHKLGPNLTDTVVTRQRHNLVTSGPYRYVRHPFYLAAALVTLSISLLSANTWVFFSGVLILAFLVVRTRREEENLLQRFGSEYRDYMQRTGRFVPKVLR